YDGLVEMLGGPPTPGIGFGIGIERVLIACDAEGALAATPPPPAAFVVDTAGGDAARDLTAALRRAGLAAERAFDGPQEQVNGTVTIRPLRGGGDQRVVPLDEVVGTVTAMTSEGDTVP